MTGSDRIETETMTANEQRRYDRLLSNIKDGVTGWARKMRAGESDAEYQAYMEDRCRDMWQRLDKKLTQSNGVKNAKDRQAR